jgi:hypothetical protein
LGAGLVAAGLIGPTLASWWYTHGPAYSVPGAAGMAGLLCGFGLGNMAVRRPGLALVQMTFVGQVLGLVLLLVVTDPQALAWSPLLYVMSFRHLVVTLPVSAGWVFATARLAALLPAAQREQLRRRGARDDMVIRVTLGLVAVVAAAGLAMGAVIISALSRGGY